jgi:renalase
MNKIAIIGAGFSASVLCHYLKEKDIIVFDKARGPGGRSSTRKVDGIGVFDHGLQYISPKRKKFLEYIQNLKLVKKWEGDFIDVETGKVLPKKDRYIGINGNNDFVKSTLDPTICKFNHKVNKIEHLNSVWNLTMDSGKQYKAETVILTLPQMQTYELIKDLNISFKTKENFMKPCFSLMLAIKNNELFKYSGYVINHSKIISWCANESSKEREQNNKDLTLLNIQSHEEYGFKNFKQYKENKEEILNEMLDEFFKIFKLKNEDIVHQNIHGWLYAFCDDVTSPVFWDKKINLGIAGDWLTGGRAENSFINSKILLNEIKKNRDYL